MENVHCNRRGNHEMTIEGHWKDQTQKTQDDDEKQGGGGGGGETYTHNT